MEFIDQLCSKVIVLQKGTLIFYEKHLFVNFDEYFQIHFSFNNNNKQLLHSALNSKTGSRGVKLIGLEHIRN